MGQLNESLFNFWVDPVWPGGQKWSSFNIVAIGDDSHIIGLTIVNTIWQVSKNIWQVYINEIKSTMSFDKVTLLDEKSILLAKNLYCCQWFYVAILKSGDPMLTSAVAILTRGDPMMTIFIARLTVDIYGLPRVPRFVGVRSTMLTGDIPILPVLIPPLPSVYCCCDR